MTLFAFIAVVGTVELLALVGVVTVHAWPGVNGLGRGWLRLPPAVEQAAAGGAPGAVTSARPPLARRRSKPGLPAQPSAPGG